MLAIAMSLLFGTVHSSGKSISTEEKQIVVVFRYDDYSSRSNTDMEQGLIDAFRRHGFSCIFGVIPYVCAGDGHDRRPQNVIALTENKAKILRDGIKTGTVEVALHGYSHQNISLINVYTEFAGLTYDKQLEKIHAGKNYLEKCCEV